MSQDLPQKKDWKTDDEWYDFYEVVVDGKQEPLRIDKFLLNRVVKVSRNRIQNAIRAGAVTVNGNIIKANYKIRPKDHIKFVLPVDSSKNTELLPEDIPLDICYEDDDILVLNKPAGLVVHPGVGNPNGTLVNALLYHHKDEKLPTLQGNTMSRAGLVHRLDKDTSGIMVTAKTDFAMTHLAKQFFDRTIERSYQAIVWGDFESKKGTVEGHIGRNPADRKNMMVFPDGETGKHAITHYEVIEDMYYVSLIKCKLETGRTHQIRVHMEHIGHPVFNDTRYGGDRIRKGTVYTKYKQYVQNCFEICQRQALHAKSLAFIHPVSGEKMTFESELPTDMQQLLERWQRYFKSKSQH